MASIEIRGLDKLFKKLGNVAAVDILEKPTQRGVLRLQRTMQEYPPQPANSRYVRTGTLGRRWTVRVTKYANGMQGKVGNRTGYGPLVQSHQFQAGIHRRTGWVTDERAVRENEKAIVADFQAAVDKALAA